MCNRRLVSCRCPRHRPHESSQWAPLDDVLRQRGDKTDLQRRVCAVFGVVSVSADLTVWTNGRALLWHYAGVPDAYLAGDVEGAAERLATLAARIGPPDTGAVLMPSGLGP